MKKKAKKVAKPKKRGFELRSLEAGMFMGALIVLAIVIGVLLLPV